MSEYIFYGRILPERAILDHRSQFLFGHPSTGSSGKISISIICSTIIVVVDTKNEWDIFDLRNVVNYSVMSHLSVIGYLKGYSYNFIIDRIFNNERQIDYVFGVNVPCVSDDRNDIDLDSRFKAMQLFLQGELGIHISRCMIDLISALRYADDTSFYCFRAIEALRNHHSAKFEIEHLERSSRWEKFREFIEVDREEFDQIGNSAKIVRHGNFEAKGASDRANYLTKTWSIVDRYIKKLESISSFP